MVGFRYIEEELAQLRSSSSSMGAGGKATQFWVSKCESKGAIFVQFVGGSACPVALVEGIVAAARRGEVSPRYVKRLMPCSKTCYANPEEAGQKPEA